MKYKYYLMVDNGCQWETVIIKIDENDKVVDNEQLNGQIQGPFIKNIADRELHFSNRQYLNNWWYGWSISEKEYNTLKRLVTLYFSYKEYLDTLGLQS